MLWAASGLRGRGGVVVRLFFFVAVWFSTTGTGRSGEGVEDGATLFSCGENGEKFPQNYVDDDYCDCPDGSDEPSTSACSHLPGSVFACGNEDWKKVVLPSSRVGDGICDCCDGSDERGSPSAVKCPDICAAKAREIIERQISQKRAVQAGMEIRSAVIKEAHRKFSSWKSRLKDLDYNLKRLRQVKERIVSKKYEELALERLEAEVLWENKDDEMPDDADADGVQDANVGYIFERDPKTGRMRAVREDINDGKTVPSIEDVKRTQEAAMIEKQPAEKSGRDEEESEVIDLGELEKTPADEAVTTAAASEGGDSTPAVETEEVADPPPEKEYVVACPVAEEVKQKHEGGERLLRHTIVIGANETLLNEYLEDDPYVKVDMRRVLRAKWRDLGSLFKLTGYDLAVLISGEPPRVEMDKHKQTVNYKRKHLFLGPIFNGGKSGWRRGLRYIFSFIGIFVSPVRLAYETYDYAWSMAAHAAGEIAGFLPDGMTTLVNTKEIRYSKLGNRTFDAYRDYVARPMWRYGGLRIRGLYRRCGGPFAMEAIWEAVPELYRYMYPPFDEEYRRPAVLAVMKCLDEAEAERKRLEDEQKTLSEALEADYGPHATMYRLSQSCFSKQFSGYSYSVCPFHNVTQDSTLLGTWHGWGDFSDNDKVPADGTVPGWRSSKRWYAPFRKQQVTNKTSARKSYRNWHFTKGQRCYQGMERKVLVKVGCGVSEEISDVAETDICVYEIKMTSPALCDHIELKKYTDIDTSSAKVRKYFSSRDEL